MKNVNPVRMVLLVTGFAGVLLVGGIAQAANSACLWKGTAPFCNGKCDTGYTATKTSKVGDGKKCATGHKVYCCLTASIHVVGKGPFCNGKCPVGEETLGYQKEGVDGSTCETGKAAICLSNF
jgi:chitinase